MTVLVDSNVILDVVVDDAEWFGWSSQALARATEQGVLVINPIIYAEVSTTFAGVEEVEAAVPATAFRRENLPWEAAFLAAKVFLAYRRRGGEWRAPLPDFYIGAHAAVAGYRLLTRDARRFRSYFPTVELIAP